MDSGLAFAAVIAGGLVTTFYVVSLLEMRKKGRKRRELEAREADTPAVSRLTNRPR